MNFCDVLTITVPIPTTYASVNQMGKDGMRRGKKSPEYIEVFRAVREAARAEMVRTGWQTIDQPCAVQIVRYATNYRRFDAPNIGKAECDALAPSTPKQEQRDKCAPFAGIYTGDHHVDPWQTGKEIDPDGPDRIVIIVRRRFEAAIAREKRQRKPKRAPHSSLDTDPYGAFTVYRDHPIIIETPDGKKRNLSGKPASEPYAMLQGVKVPLSEAHKIMRGEK